MKKIILKIDGMTCSGCSNGLEKYLNKQEGIIRAGVNLVLAQAVIECNDDVTVKDLNRYVHEAGFESLGEYDDKIENRKDNSKFYLIGYGILAIIILYVSMGHMLNMPSLPFFDMEKNPINYTILLFILVIPFLIYGYDIFKSGIQNMIHRTLNMDTLVTIGVFASFIYSFYEMVTIIFMGNSANNLYFESCALIIYFIKLGRVFDKKSREKTTEALKELVAITPQSAILKDENGEREVTIDEIKKGDILVCRPGQRISADGIITKGTSHFNETFITGEAMPVSKTVGDDVIAGSISIDGYTEYKAFKIGKESMISEVVRLVREGASTKSKSIRLADKISSYFIPFVVIIALITFSYYLFSTSLNSALIHFVSVLLTACPCALGLGAPLAITISYGLCAQNGILVKESEILEESCLVDTIVFDKTGTLTKAELKVANIINYSSYSKEDIISLIGSLESKSSHPLAKAFMNYVNMKKVSLKEVKSFNELAGIGLTAVVGKKKVYVGNNKLFEKLKIENEHQKDEEKLSSKGESVFYLIVDNKPLALVSMADTIRDNAHIVVKKLQEMGMDVIMLTGDNSLSAESISAKLNINKYASELMPKEKVKYIKDLIDSGKKVMMVGDGINDAPSLAYATVGVSFKNATDVAADSSSVVLTSDDLEKILTLITISKKTSKIIKENLFWAFFYNTCMLSFATGLFSPFGITMSPMLASISMTLSSISVVLNSLRLRKFYQRKVK